jgi:hypothetical protein
MPADPGNMIGRPAHLIDKHWLVVVTSVDNNKFTQIMVHRTLKFYEMTPIRAS